MAERISMPAHLRDEVAPEGRGVGVSAYGRFCGGRAADQAGRQHAAPLIIDSLSLFWGQL